MRMFTRSRSAGVSCAAALLVACGTLPFDSAQGKLAQDITQLPIGEPGTMPPSSAIAERGGSWMLPTAKSQDLLYVSDIHAVTVFTYPQGKLVGTLRNFSLAGGLCIDAAQDVFVTDSQKGDIVEFAHGGTKSIRTLSDTNQGPNGCSVDAKTGNLAAANSSGSISVYQMARGNPKLYTNPEFISVFYCGYDNAGNLFVDGDGYYNFNYYFAYGVLRPNGKFNAISLDENVGTPGQIQWDGAYFALGGITTGIIYRLRIIHGYGVIKRVTRPSAPLNELFWIEQGTLIVPIDGYDTVEYFHYPAGGKPTKTIMGGLERPFAAAVSFAPGGPR